MFVNGIGEIEGGFGRFYICFVSVEIQGACGCLQLP